MILARIHSSKADRAYALGWRFVAGHVSPSVGICLLMEWGGAGEPVMP